MLFSRTYNSSGVGTGTFARRMCRKTDNSSRGIFGETLEDRLDTQPLRDLCRQNTPIILVVRATLKFQGTWGTAGTYNFARHFFVGIALG